MTAYSDYCNAEKAEGRKPLPPKEWSEARKGTPPPAEAEGFAPQPGPNDHDHDPEDAMPHEDAEMIGRLQAHAESLASEDPLEKARRLRMEAAALEAQVLGVTPEDQREKREKKAAEAGEWIFKSDSNFHEITLWSRGPRKEDGHHYPAEHIAAKFSYGVYRTTNPDHAAKLMESVDYQKGSVFLVDEMIQNAVVGVLDGPRTTSTSRGTVRERPAGALSAPLD